MVVRVLEPPPWVNQLIPQPDAIGLLGAIVVDLFDQLNVLADHAAIGKLVRLVLELANEVFELEYLLVRQSGEGQDKAIAGGNARTVLSDLPDLISDGDGALHGALLDDHHAAGEGIIDF